MSLGQLLLVAFVQGLTEYLPISSSAHLILLPWAFDFPDQGLSVDVAAHTGTFLAAVVFFRRDLAEVVRGLGGGRRRGGQPSPGRHLALLLAIGSVPVLLGGFVFQQQIATVARDPLVIAVTSILFALVLWGADHVGRRLKSMEELTVSHSLIVGFAQALALIPGTSRSGATISAGLFLDLTREEAARFSFLLSIPVSAVVAMNELFELRSHPPGSASLWELFLVFAVSGVVGHFCIAAFLRFLQSRGMTPFVIYRLALGVVILLWMVFAV